MAKVNIPVVDLVARGKPRSPAGTVLTSWKGKIVIQRRKSPTGKPKSQLQRAWVENFKQLNCMVKWTDPAALNNARDMWTGNNWTYRDALISAFSGKLYGLEGEVKISTPSVQVRRTTTESLTANVQKTLTPNTKDWDNNFFWNPSSNPERLTFRTAGLYIILAQVSFSGGTAGYRYLNAYKNGSVNKSGYQFNAAAGLGNENTCFFIDYFHANEYVVLKAVTPPSGITAQIDFSLPLRDVHSIKH